ncbi:MAG TPA: hypothetical protein VKA18_01485 [Alphaproteobacteria bacterium]|nr:hypothetical protein [Alphaproteobacteria bacterium]
MRFSHPALLIVATVGGGLWAASASAQQVHFGVDLPDPGIPGFSFPAPETTINAWIGSGNERAIYRHGWGVWTALSAASGTDARGIPNAPVYLTWADPGEIAAVSKAANAAAALTQAKQSLVLQAPRQHGEAAERTATVETVRTSYLCGASGAPDTCILVTVNYSPAAAHFALDNKILLEETLQTYWEDGYEQIPTFPTATVNVKPVYKIISPAKLVDERYYTMPAWPGTPVPPKTFPETDWGQCIFIDVTDQSAASGAVDKTCDTRTADNTYNLSDFIHFKVTEDDQHQIGELVGDQFKGNPLEVGDTIILVGMHVTTREITRWTWQTFWWVPDPDAPLAPSSVAIARARPDQLQGAARNYAMAIAYQMLMPAQPLTGGTDVGELMPAYNPHLEAGFDPATFQEKRPVQTNNGPVTTRYGVETNCMTCHGLALYDPGKDYADEDVSREDPYGSNFYLGRDDRVFDRMLQLDFAWSVLGSMIAIGEGGRRSPEAHEPAPE